MGTIQLPPDFKDFLRSLNSTGVEYLLIGGYAVGYHGYSRSTADMDVWVLRSADNARKIVAAVKGFGFNTPDVRESLFQENNRIIRMGLPPLRIEILTDIDGVTFAACRAAADIVDIEGLQVPVISLSDLKKNKKAAGRHKDLDDLEHLG